MRRKLTKGQRAYLSGRHNAPRLIEGSRDGIGGGLPPVVRQWARMQAEREGKSFSYWLEGLIGAEFERCDQRRNITRLYRIPAAKQTAKHAAKGTK